MVDSQNLITFVQTNHQTPQSQRVYIKLWLQAQNGDQWIPLTKDQ